MLTLLFDPYKRKVHNDLSAGAQGALLSFLVGSHCVKLYDDLSKQWTEEETQTLLGFDSPQQILAIIFIMAVTVVFFVVAGLVQGLAADKRLKTLRIEGGAMPELTLSKEHSYHLFLSHIWSSGQDQVAVVKRRLQQLMPGCSIFLDVDDLDDISKLGEYITVSADVLIFLSAATGSRLTA